MALNIIILSGILIHSHSHALSLCSQFFYELKKETTKRPVLDLKDHWG